MAFGIVYIRGGGDLLGGGELGSTGGEDIVVRVDRLSVNGDEVLNFGVRGGGAGSPRMPCCCLGVSLERFSKRLSSSRFSVRWF